MVRQKPKPYDSSVSNAPNRELPRLEGGAIHEPAEAVALISLF
jgi:hypothetical protein